MSKFWFDNEEQKKCIIPFKHISEKTASIYRLENSNMKFKQEVLDDMKALNNTRDCLMTMLMSARTTKKIVLDEEDLEFLLKMVNKEIQLDFSKLGGIAND